MNNEADKGNRRFFAITSLGRTRWYWVVWPSLVELQTAQTPLLHIAEGYEKTKAEAVERALEAAGRYSKWIAAKYARAYHHNTRFGKTLKGYDHPKSDSSAVPVVHEFLYRDVYDVSTKQWISKPHRVARTTQKYVYVEQQAHASDDLAGSWLDGEHPTYRLDRQALEQNGYAFIPTTAYLADGEEPLFFNFDRIKQQGGESPECLDLLNLSWPCTVTEVQEAYRRLVKSAHPDGGGNHDKFLALQAAYEEALRLCR